MNVFVGSLATLLIAAATLAAAQARPGKPVTAPVASHPRAVSPASPHQAVIDQYCVGCHNDR